MASFSHAVSVAAPPADAFPWLIDADKVPEWTEGISEYAIAGDGPVAVGTQIRVALTVGGHALRITYEVAVHEPPSTLTLRSETSGIHVDSTYRVEPEGDGSRITQSVELDARGMKAKLIAPMVRSQMEPKFAADLERLREQLATPR